MSRHIHVRSDFDLEPRMGSDMLRGHRDFDCVTPKLEREPTYGELGTDIDAGYSPYQGNLERLLHQQQQMIGLQQQTFQTMASTIKQGFPLPKPDISKFDGNPLDYWNFVRCFDNGIAKNALDDGERLSYLLQYCTGAGRDAIKSCLALDSAVGCQTARTLLEERFGHPYKIAAAHLNRITRGAPLKHNDQRGLLTFADQLRDCQNVLESIGYMDEINSADNLRNVIERLPFHLKVKWLEVADRLRENGLRPRIHHISEFVSKRARAVNDPVFGNVVTCKRGKVKKLSYPNQSRGASFLSQAKLVPSCERRGWRNDNPGVNQSSHNIFGKCVVCNGLHQLWNCEEFKQKPYAERIKKLREHKLCDNCFKVGHTARGCLQRSACYIEGCNKRHMTVIHPPQLSLPDHVYTSHSCEVEPSSCFARNRPNQSYAARYSVGSSRDAANQGHITESDVNTSGNLSTQSHAIGAGAKYHGSRNQPTSTRICLRIVPVRVHDNNSGRTLETYTLLDNGSDVSLCDAELVKELYLQGERRDFLLTTQEKKDSAKSGLELKLTISSLDGTSALEIQRVWTVDRLKVLSRRILRAEDVQGWSHLSGIELPEIQNKDVTVLIGCNVPEAFWVMQERRGKRGEPIAVRSLLGWTLMGPTENHQEDSSFSMNFVRLEDSSNSRDEALLSQVEKFWKTDLTH
ncbi:hypothetical protein P5673_010736 [Acropora cervicornis]|uniref:Peptidase aspartic putative domain-containing protein n=1 Tax=Acropora cervicornis TaxID=6130 RepID=A0AAD9V8V5_ACRCE|nr:hypothetical protein P5673_010736 [Acropora cervicornis]